MDTYCDVWIFQIATFGVNQTIPTDQETFVFLPSSARKFHGACCCMSDTLSGAMAETIVSDNCAPHLLSIWMVSLTELTPDIPFGRHPCKCYGTIQPGASIYKSGSNSEHPARYCRCCMSRSKSKNERSMTHHLCPHRGKTSEET